MLDPTAAQDVATKAYVDAQGGGCYSKCADSGTSAGGATPSCPGGYSSVDTWSERAGFGQWQWGGMNSSAFDYNTWTIHSNMRVYTKASYAMPWSGNSIFPPGLTENTTGGIAVAAWNTGYGSGSGTTSYYNDCVACCAD